MTLSKVNPFTMKPTDLPDSPSPLYSAQEIKEHFQTPADELKTAHNKLVDDLEAPTGASALGAQDGESDSTVQAVLNKLSSDKATNDRVITAENRITGTEGRLTTAESDIDSLFSKDQSLQSEVNISKSDISSLKANKADKTEVQAVQSQVNALVVDGDSSPAIAQALAGSPYTTLKQKLDSTDTLLAERVKKGEVSVSDIDKNKGKFDQTYLTDELLQQIAGNAPINAVPANDSITTEKLTFIPLIAEPSTNLFDKSTVTLGKSVNGGDGTLLDNAPYNASDFIKIKPSTQYVLETGIVGAFYDVNKNFVSGYGGENPFTTPANAMFFRTTTVTANLDKQQLSLGSVLPPYENPIAKVPSASISNNVISSIVDEALVNTEKRYYKSYFKAVVDHLNNPFIKTQIKLIGDSITAGVGGTGYDAAGDTVEGKHVTNVLSATCWANMLYDFVDKKYNKYHYISMNNPNIIWSTPNSYQPAVDGTTILNTFTLFNNGSTTDGLEFDIYGDSFGVVYSSNSATGIFDIYVDGAKVATVDTYTPSQGYRNEYMVTGLTKGNHRVKIQETNTKNPASSAKTIYLEALKIFKTAFVLNYGSSGAPSRFDTSYYNADDDFVFIQFGTNDRQTYFTTTSTENNLMEHVNYINENLNAKIIFMSANPVGVANDTDPIRKFRMEDVDIVVNKVASSLGLPYISNYDAFIRYAKETGVSVDAQLADGLHPNDLGYRVMFENICREIGLPILREGITL